TAESVLEDLRQFLDLVQSRLGVPRIYFISIKLSPSRRGRWAHMRRANHLIEDFVSGRSGVTFIDVNRAMLDRNGEPKLELFRWDRIHLSAEGYKVWTSIIKPILQRDLKSVQ